MSLKELVESNFEKLIRQGEDVLRGREETIRRDIYTLQTVRRDIVNRGESTSWGLALITYLGSVFGKESEIYSKANQLQNMLPNGEPAEALLGVVRSALDIWRNGYHLEVETFASSEVFADFFQMAESLLGSPYHPAAAATLAGGVLEEHLRSMCARRGISLKKDSGRDKSLGSLNEALAAAKVYIAVKKQQVEAWIKLRNAAAHGRWDEVEEDDVRRMLEGVRSFCADVS